MRYRSYTFYFEYDDSNNERYSGIFTCKRLTIEDHSRIDLLKEQYCGSMICVKDKDGNATGEGIPEEIEFFNKVLATLNVSIIDKPAWFDLENINDTELVMEIWRKINQHESRVYDFEGNFVEADSIIEGAKKIALTNVRKPRLVTSIRRWAVKKYSIPWNSPYLQTRTIDDLLIEFYEDYYENNPKEQLKDAKNEDGEIVLDTGDRILDKIERDLALGLDPDLSELLPANERKEYLDKISKKTDTDESNLNILEDVEIDEVYAPTPDMDYRKTMINKLRKANML